MSKTKKVCVLGGTGFIGQSIVQRLARNGCQVRILTRNRERHRELLVLPSVELIEADIHERNVLKDQFSGMDAVINVVGILNELDNKKRNFQTVHVKLARLVVDACQANKVTRLLHMSALNANANRGASKYLRSKGEAENIVNTTNNLKVTTFRPSVVFGPHDTFFNRFATILRLMPFFIPLPLACAKSKFQPVYVEDVAEMFVRSLNDKKSYGQRYNLCGPKQYSLQEIVALTSKVMGLKRSIIPLGEGLSRLQSLFLGQMLTVDNILSMRADAVCNEGFPGERFGIQPASVEMILPTYLGTEIARDPMDKYRKVAGR